MMTGYPDQPARALAAQRRRKPLLRDPVRLERAIGVIVWLVLLAVLFRVGF